MRRISRLVASTISICHISDCDIRIARMAVCRINWTATLLRHSRRSTEIQTIRILDNGIGRDRSIANGCNR